ncbi:lipoyl(octanoyl) transferase LipB [Candidatus Bandiella euplotis]|uniref:Octanoyltransferase n=1 Tax=Candidatus Bandiella euplotis TaxID=1664265 RepID=A0ABZ0UP98_9RICK|nr:lipoyl(octanoyl) transferase LipB [Candidatus Bandiella woodruffii]WPX97382.1 Octanoyltransferase [Candidatus Bandiella woodruffii]
MDKIDFIYSYGNIEYSFALNYMKQKVEDINKNISNQAVWLLEHPSIYTAGRSADDSDILNKLDIPYYYTDRGGKFTYHGPGQMIIYIMLDIQRLFLGKPDVRIFIKKIGTWIIKVLQQTGIDAYLDGDNIGIWVGDGGLKRKIASIGIKLSKWISYHGIALNINPDMSYFQHIVPCGITDYQMTSIELEIGEKLTYSKLNSIVRDKFFEEFSYLLGLEYEISNSG